eukprot:3852293-Amphidinium_carterae.2
MDRSQLGDGQTFAIISLAGRLMKKGTSLRTLGSATSVVRKRVVRTVSVFDVVCFVRTRRHPEFSQALPEQQFWGDAQNPWNAIPTPLASGTLVIRATLRAAGQPSDVATRDDKRARRREQRCPGHPVQWRLDNVCHTAGKEARFQTLPQPTLERVWLPPQYRIGEASHPGPEVLTCNSNSWKNAPAILTKGCDLVHLQETCLVKDKVAGAVREAFKLGYYSSFVPAKEVQEPGRPSGGLAILCKDGKCKPAL